MVHPLGPLRERLRHVRAPSKALPYRLRPAKSTMHLVLPLALVDEIVAMAALEVPPWTVEDSNPLAASRSGTDKPRPLPTEVARGPVEGDALLHVFPFSAWTAPVAV